MQACCEVPWHAGAMKGGPTGAESVLGQLELVGQRGQT